MKKNNFNKVKTLWLTALIIMLCGNLVKAQDSTASSPPKPKPVKGTFAGPVLIDNQTVNVPNKSALTFMFQHRFGNLNTYSDGYGLFNISSILIGCSYVPVSNVEVGFGICSYNMTWDLHAKIALLRQSKTGGWPVSVTYYGSAGIDSRDKSNFVSTPDRFTYFHEIMIARKITSKLSMQVAPSLSYFNNVPGYYDADGKIKEKMNNAQFTLSFIGRYKLTNATAIIADYDQPMTQNVTNNPHPNLAAGFEFETSGHTFQIFLGNYGYCLHQLNNFLNQNDYTKKGNFLIGFNITRF